MAEGKKTFVAYANWMATFEKLTDEEAGRLIKHLFRYVNDLDPEPPDRMIELVFEQFKQILKVDLDKWESIRERNKINGSKGGRPKKDKEPKKPTGLIGNPKKPRKADNDNDNDNDNVNANANALSKDNRTPFDLVVQDWFAYKRERKESYKSERSRKAFITSLTSLSGGDVETARKIIHQSMANNWAGIFELKNKINGSEKESNIVDI